MSITVKILGDDTDLQKKLGASSVSIAKWGTAAVAASAAAATAMAAMMKVAVGEFIVAEQSLNRLSALMKVSGGAAGLTLQEIEGHVQRLSSSLFINDEAIRDNAAGMLFYRNVVGDTFIRVLELGTQMSLLGGEFQDAAKTMARALEAPEQAGRMLRTLKIILTDAEEDLIKSYTASGEIMKAQAVIMKRLESTAAGLAGEMNKGIVLESRKASVAWGEMVEAFGRAFNRPASSVFSWFADEFKEVEYMMNSASWKEWLYVMSGAKAVNTTLRAVLPAPLKGIVPGGGTRATKEDQADPNAAARKAAAELKLIETAAHEASVAIGKKNLDAMGQLAADAAKANKTKIEAMRATLKDRIGAIQESTMSEEALEKKRYEDNIATAVAADKAGIKVKGGYYALLVAMDLEHDAKMKEIREGDSAENLATIQKSLMSEAQLEQARYVEAMGETIAAEEAGIAVEGGYQLLREQMFAAHNEKMKELSIGKSAEDLARIQESLMTETEALQFHLDNKLLQLQTARDLELITDAELTAMKVKLEEERGKALIDIRKRTMSEMEQLQFASQQVQLMAAWGAGTDMLAAAGTMNDKLAKAGRISGAAQALVATYVGAAEALKLGWPLGFAAAGAVMAKGLGLVAAIRSGGKGGGGGGGVPALTAPSVIPGTTIAPTPGTVTPSPIGGTLTVRGISAGSLISGEVVQTLVRELLEYQRRGGQVVLV